MNTSRSSRALSDRITRIKDYRLRHGVSLGEARDRSCDDALDDYKRVTGVRLSNAEELYAVRLSDYGRLCPHCGKPFRTPLAKLCAACGFQLPPGEVAGPASA